MFIKIQELRINFDNIVSYWAQIKKEEWHSTNGIEIKNRYFLYVQDINKHHEFEFDTLDGLESVIDMLDGILKPIEQ